MDMEAVESALTWLIVIGLVIMVAGLIVMRMDKRKKP